ncbi:hypothetical protein BON30_13330 [Cystobacter ferrugineus]|uniref:Uncharacterized protein n=2 Tax=Cystobacter ferrugineus TaxID=83449 RepID=A0A1L9BCR7_9BACT|nr:hypothetical protein BON30_13330 [Cystobacter ferrugineus]
MALGVLFGLWPQVSQACRCLTQPNDTNLAQALRTAREAASHIYFARVQAADGLRSGNATVEVLEVLKGELAVGTRLRLPSGGGGSCAYPFKKGNDYLVYAHGGPTAVRMCTRTRPILADDVELQWLRTGKLPATPSALRREVVTCKPCDLNAVARAPALFQNDARQAHAARRAFWTQGLGSENGRAVAVGQSKDLRAFELVQTPHEATDEKCRQRIVRRWCERLAPLSSKAQFPFRCINPGPEEQVCDENKDRVSKWMPLESMTTATCTWDDPNAPSCKLSKKVQPRPGPHKASAPLLRCSLPREDTGWHHCQVITGE